MFSARCQSSQRDVPFLEKVILYLLLILFCGYKPDHDILLEVLNNQAGLRYLYAYFKIVQKISWMLVIGPGNFNILME